VISIMENPYHFLKVIDGIFTEEESKELINRADKAGWEFVDRGIANYWRSIIVDENLADYIFQGIQHVLPKKFGNQHIVKLSSHFRLSKYDTGGRFEKHTDGINIDNDGLRACMTLNIFLNVPEEGGGTIFYYFYKDEERVLENVRPVVGRGALFYNQIRHEGEKVSKGHKYLIRTDVMATSVP